MRNLEEQLINLSRNSGSKQYDTNVDIIVNDLKKKHVQEVASLQDQYKSVIEQIKSKVSKTFSGLKRSCIFNKFCFIQDHHCTLLTNELKKLQQEHHNTITENNVIIHKLTKEIKDLHKNKLSDSNNYDDIANLNSQLIECSKQNQQLNDTLQKLTVSVSYF